MNIQTFISRIIIASLCAVTLACGGSSPTAPSATAAPPQSTSVSPATGVRGTSVPVTLTGAQFATGATTAVTVSGDGVSVTNVAVQSATTVTATLTIAPDATLGARTISATNTGGTGQALTFTVLPPPPTLEAVTPLLVQAGASTVVTLKGTNFVNAGTTVAISGTGLSVSDVSVTDAKTLTVSVSASQAAAIGVRKMTVTTAGGTSSEQSLGVVPPPIVVTSVTGGHLRMGETTTIRIFGSGFIPGVTTVTSSNPAVKVVAVRVLNAPSSAAPGRARPADVSATGTVMEVDIRAELDQFFTTFTGVFQKLQVSLSIKNNFDSVLNEMLAAFSELLEAFYALLGKLGVTGFAFDLPIEVAAPLPKIGAFVADPPVVTLGQSSTLRWRGIEYARTCSIGSIGDVPCQDGSVAVSPAATTEYKLSVVGAGGDFEWTTATVTVEIPPPPVTGPPSTTPTPSATSATFTPVGSVQSFTVPAGVTQVTLETSGGAGGGGAGGALGGLGGRVTATIAVTPGETLSINVGYGGSAGSTSAPGFGGNGAGVGGNGGIAGIATGGGGGGGASSVSRGSTVLALAGGGGGGGGNNSGSVGGNGGAGGGAGTATSGSNAGVSIGGGGASQTSVGAGGFGFGTNGSAGGGVADGDGGQGGTPIPGGTVVGGGGGGGGGLFGGGGGAGGNGAFSAGPGAGGGGGSSTVIGTAMGVTHAQGVQSGNGLVVIRW